MKKISQYKIQKRCVVLKLHKWSFPRIVLFISNVFTQSLLHSVYNNTGSPQDVKSSWHLASSSGNQISDSFKSITLCTGRSSILWPSLPVFSINNLTRRTKLSASEFLPSTFAIGHWLRLASVFSRTISPFWKCLCFSFHLWQGWSDYRNSFRHLTQNSLAICCIRLSSFSTVFISLHKMTRWWQNYLGLHGENVAWAYWLLTLHVSLCIYRQRPRVYNYFCLCQKCPHWFIV